MPHPAVALAAWIDPAVVFAGLAAEHPNVFWLDAGPSATGGWSFVGSGQPASVDRVRDVVCGGVTQQSDVPFAGGWVGWCGYDDAAARAGSPAAVDAHDDPRDLWLKTDTVLAFDHASRRAWAMAPQPDAVRAALPRWAAAAAAPRLPPPVRTAGGRHTASEYAELIGQCRDAIRDGDAYQLCLTTRFTVAGDIDPIGAYAALRAATPTHHGGIIMIPGAALLSASPERFLDVADGVVRTLPIKGTRPRASDATRDAALARDLARSDKERAENVMIVDLMRNDLARVCHPSTVTVEKLLEIESYAAVHQLVSTIAGRLLDGKTVGDLLDAAFPAGSMTGAPKLSAMTILHRLERLGRGVFAGCFGWIGDDGALDLAMVIRSIVIQPEGAYVGAGGGITWRSDATDEVAEVAVKARAPLAALGASLPPGW